VSDNNKSSFIFQNQSLRNKLYAGEKLKPYVLEPPAQAQQLSRFGQLAFFTFHTFQLISSSGSWDFFPWKGNHPEDRVTDVQARNGQYDKLFVGKNQVLSAGCSQSELVLTALQNEQASAKVLLSSAFRGRNGLHSLTSYFITVSVKRQQFNTILTASTFKPPPRVTLPDQRREAWLRDLANPTVPLRRLSRTIPHGLKGPTLLHQCAAKNIPTTRAVWFIRCVGANELRGLKRKGVGSLAVGGELKWIKEWTAQVMQFLDKAFANCESGRDNAHLAMCYSYALSFSLVSWCSGRQIHQITPCFPYICRASVGLYRFFGMVFDVPGILLFGSITPCDSFGHSFLGGYLQVSAFFKKIR
jgi:mediator of RNA polymerase II transcription subunit 12